MQIPVNLGDVQSAFEDLPHGSYMVQCEAAKYVEPKEQGKFAQLRVQWVVIDGELINRRHSQWLSFSPNAAGFMKQFFDKFGLGDTANFDVDPETMDLLDPYIVGARGIIKLTPDKKDADRTRTTLVSVEDDDQAAPAPAPAARPAARPATPVAPRPVARQAAPAVEEAELAEASEEEAAVEDEAPVDVRASRAAPPAPRRPQAPAAAPARPAPQRRTLR